MNTQSWNIYDVLVMTIFRELFLSPKFVALTPNAWNWPRLSIPGQGALHGPVWAISRDSWELWKLRPFIRRLSIVAHEFYMISHPVSWPVCMTLVSGHKRSDNSCHLCHTLGLSLAPLGRTLHTLTQQKILDFFCFDCWNTVLILKIRHFYSVALETL